MTQTALFSPPGDGDRPVSGRIHADGLLQKLERLRQGGLRDPAKRFGRALVGRQRMGGRHVAHAQEGREGVGLERARKAPDEVELVEARLLGDLIKGNKWA